MLPLLLLSWLAGSSACSRAFYESGTGGCFTGRTMDWFEAMDTELWIFPRGLKRDGGVGEGSLQWVSKYGSVVASVFHLASTDGVNEAGLAGNILYLVDSDYGHREGQKKISVGAWLQLMLDQFATVREAVDYSRADNLTIVAPNLPDGTAASVHLALSDARNDSAIFEFIDGRLRIHHGSQFRVMTNSPPYDQQVALSTYWKLGFVSDHCHFAWPYLKAFQKDLERNCFVDFMLGYARIY